MSVTSLVTKRRANDDAIFNFGAGCSSRSVCHQTRIQLHELLAHGFELLLGG